MTTPVVTDEQLGIYARREHDLFRRVREGTLPIERVLAALQGTIEGNFDAVPQPSGRVIDLLVSPYIPDGWSIHPEDQIASRVQGDTLEFDPAKVRFHLDPAQHGGTIVGTKLKEQLAGQPVLPANVLDALLADTRRIPDSWKQDEAGNTRYIYFWGTVYRARDGRLYVRYLCWLAGRWLWFRRYLTNEFDAENLAALLAS